MNENETNPQTLTFEQAFEALTETVRKLEGDSLPLAEMLALYEQGIALAKQCDQQLEQAELSVKELISNQPASQL